MKFIDYTFYNFANLFYKEDGSDGLRASLIISIGYFFLIILASYLIVIIYAGSIEQAKIWLSKNQNNSFLCILILFPIVTILNYSHYRSKYYELKEKWSNHTLKTEPLRIISSMSIYLCIIFLTIYTIITL